MGVNQSCSGVDVLPGGAPKVLSTTSASAAAPGRLVGVVCLGNVNRYLSEAAAVPGEPDAGGGTSSASRSATRQNGSPPGDAITCSHLSRRGGPLGNAQSLVTNVRRGDRLLRKNPSGPGVRESWRGRLRAALAPLREVQPLGAERGVVAVAGRDPGLVGKPVEQLVLHVVDQRREVPR